MIKVIDKRESDEFSNLTPGTPFMVDGALAIKIWPVDGFNLIYLETGKPGTASPGCPVAKVEVEVHING